MMDIDEESAGTLGENVSPGREIIEYSKKSIGAMGRWLTQLYRATASHPTNLMFCLFLHFRDEVIGFLDSIDNRVEALRTEALKLQDQHDHLLTQIDMLKNTDFLSNLNKDDQEEVASNLMRINGRLQVSSAFVLVTLRL